MRKKSAKQAARSNMRVFMEKGPGLHWDYSTYVVAKDTARGKILIGGLGAIGVGQMWSDIRDEDRDRPGFDDAPEQSSEGGFGAGGDAIANAMRELDALVERTK